MSMGLLKFPNNDFIEYFQHGKTITEEYYALLLDIFNEESSRLQRKKFAP